MGEEWKCSVSDSCHGYKGLMEHVILHNAWPTCTAI